MAQDKKGTTNLLNLSISQMETGLRIRPYITYPLKNMNNGIWNEQIILNTILLSGSEVLIRIACPLTTNRMAAPLRASIYGSRSLFL